MMRFLFLAFAGYAAFALMAVMVTFPPPAAAYAYPAGPSAPLQN